MRLVSSGERDSILSIVINISINLNKKHHVIDPRKGNFEQAPDIQDILSELNLNAHDYYDALSIFTDNDFQIQRQSNE